ncbi:MAG: NUDIX hydrolase, partial [Thermoproteota archaeon]
MYVFKGKRISVRIEGVHSRDGKIVEKEIVEHPGAVVILPFLDNNKVVAVRQFRVAINDWIYELPAGTLDRKETPEECALRELEEEKGYRAREIKEMFRMYPAPGYSSEIIHSFLATNLEKSEQKLESSEVIYPIIVEFNELLSLILK